MMFKLAAIKGFGLFCLVVFINAFVDLGHKIIIQNTIFKIYDGDMQIMLSALVNALILLPFIFMMTPSSYVADKYSKTKVMRYSALAAVAITMAITLFYYLGWFWPAFVMTLLLAVQSAIYSPAKYGYIKELVGVEQLAQGNGVIQAITTTAILLGTLAFSYGFEVFLAGVNFTQPAEVMMTIAPLGFVLVALSLIEWLATFGLSQKQPTVESSRFNFKGYLSGKSGFSILREVYENKVIFRSIVGLALFWSLCQVVLAAYPAFAKEVADIDNTVIIQGAMAFAGIGIVIGAALAGHFSRNYIETGLVPVGAMGVTTTITALSFIHEPVLQGLNFFLLGVFGGLYLVPLNALIQYHAEQGKIGRVLAGNNFVQNIVMLTFLLLTILVAYLGVNSIGIFGVLAVIAALGTLYTVRTLPQTLARFVVSVVFSLRYRLTVQGMHHIPSQGGVLLLGNHISWIDWAIIQMASPRPVRFVMARSIYDRWYLRKIFDFFKIIPVSSGASKQALDLVNQSLNQGEVVCLFPEGGISRTGHLDTFQRGFEVAAKETNAVIVPFYLRGLWGSRFSRSSDRLKAQRNQQSFSDITVAFGEAMPVESDRFVVKQAVQSLSINTWTSYTETLETLPEAIVSGLKRQGSEMAISDITGGSMSGDRLLTAARLFAKQLPETASQNLGLLIPSSSAGIIANIACFLTGRTAVNINFTANAASISGAIEKAKINTIITSRKFLQKLESKGFDTDVLNNVNQIIYMEDFKESISKADYLLTLGLVKFMPSKLLAKLFINRPLTTDPAVILFSSGSEGTPKGVMLSHRNLMSNIKQVSDILNTQSDDVVMSTLPLFHAFGLTITTLLPLVEGLPVICHPDPTDVRNISRGIATYRGTIFCGTSTFLGMYVRNKKVEPLMLESLRVVVAGAEKLNQDVRDGFKLKFNKTIYEGYGATETTPVASVNLPDKLKLDTLKTQIGNKLGTVGMPLPGSRIKIVDPETFQELPAGEDGLILIGGNQVMLGYLGDPDKTASVITEDNKVRWYHTGDKGHLDEDGFLVIVDRYSRFAKVGGEMVSLGAVETAIKEKLNADIDLVATAIPDAKKGEKIVLLHTGSDEAELKTLISTHLLPLMQPSKLFHVNEIPKLGSGKTDYNSIKKLALSIA